MANKPHHHFDTTFGCLYLIRTFSRVTCVALYNVTFGDESLKLWQITTKKETILHRLLSTCHWNDSSSLHSYKIVQI
jgi:hypothetical protein